MKYIFIFVGVFILAGVAFLVMQESRSEDSACSRLPKSLAESILDVELKDPKSQKFGGNPRQTVISNCQFVAENNQTLNTLTFTIRIGGIPYSSVAADEDFIMTMKQQFGQRYELKKLKNLGDAAVWDASLQQLTVFKGQATYVLSSHGSTIENIEDKLITLARKTI